MFDYIFYRLYDFYNRKEHGVTPIATAALYLSVLQFLMVFCICMIVTISISSVKGDFVLPINKNYLMIGSVVAALLLDIYNYKKYKQKCNTLIYRYKNHKLNKKFKVWMLYFIGAGLFVFPILYKSILKILFSFF